MNIKTSVVLLISIFTSSASIMAQKNQFSLSVGPSLGFPLNFADGYKSGFGGGVRGYYGTTEKGAAMLNVNTLSFASKFSSGTSANITSVKIGYRTFFNTTKLFFYGDGGLIFKSGNTGKTGSDFGIGGGFGYSIPVSPNSHIDLIPSFNIVFQDVQNRTWLDLHLAYRFGFKKK